MENAAVPASNALVQDGRAYESIIKPFREIEDAALMGPDGRRHGKATGTCYPN